MLSNNDPLAKVVSKHGDPEQFGEREIEVLGDLSKVPYNTPLYTHPAEPAVVQIREAMETAAARGNDARLDIGNAHLRVTYQGIKWEHWQIGLNREYSLSIEEFDEILAKELAPC